MSTESLGALRKTLTRDFAIPWHMLLLLVFLLFFLALGASIYWGFFILYPLLGGLLGMGFVAWRRGYRATSIARMALGGSRKAWIVIELLVHIGALTASWRASGVVCFLVYHGLGCMSPPYFLVGAFLLSCAFSFLLGTSLGTVSVLGIALIVIAKGGGLSVPMAAGAIVAGAFFGDRCSPMSSSAYLVAGVTRTDFYTNFVNMLKTGLLPLLLSLGAYAFLASTHGLETFDPAFIAGIDQAFVRHPAMILPPLLVLGGSACRLPFKYVMPASTLAALGIALLVQGISLPTLLGSLLWGYAPAEQNAVTRLFAGGGWISVWAPMLIIFFSSAIAGIFDGAHLLTDVEKMVARLYRACGGYLTNLAVSLVTAAAACNQTLAILLCSQLQLSLHESTQHSREKFALMLENSVIVISALIPWNIAVSVPLSILDAPSSSLYYAFFLWILPLTGWYTPFLRQHEK